MKRVRLLPVVVAAASALLFFKTVGLITHGGYVLTGALPVAAQSASTDSGGQNATQQASISKADAAAAARAADALFSADPVSAGDAKAPADAVPKTANSDGTLTNLRSADGAPLTDKQILERLGQRRDELDKRAADLDARAAIVAAAEKKLQQRIDELKALQAKVDALVAEKKAMDDKQFASLVAVYEAMRPNDAASIFNKLSMDILVKVAENMSPRKLAPVVAKMDPAVAQTLTVQMAEGGAAGGAGNATGKPRALPQIVGQ